MNNKKYRENYTKVHNIKVLKPVKKRTSQDHPWGEKELCMQKQR